MKIHMHWLSLRILIAIGLVAFSTTLFAQVGPSAPKVDRADITGIGRISPGRCTSVKPCERLKRGSKLHLRLIQEGYATAFLQDRQGKFFNQEGRLCVNGLIEGDVGLWPDTDSGMDRGHFALWIVTSNKPIAIHPDHMPLSVLPHSAGINAWGPVYLSTVRMSGSKLTDKTAWLDAWLPESRTYSFLYGVVSGGGLLVVLLFLWRSGRSIKIGPVEVGKKPGEPKSKEERK